MTTPRPLLCCATHSAKVGKSPSMDVRCPSCADYRGYLEHVHSLMVERHVSAEPVMSYKAQMAQKKSRKG